MFGFLKSGKKTDKPRILIVEDEPDLAQTIQDRLEMNEYVVIRAENGQEGLEKAIEEQPDLILLDVNMPVMDGFQMLEALRNHPKGSHLVVMMVTVSSQKDDVTRAEARGVEDYIVKPFELADLVDKIEQVLRQRSTRVE
jgi:DNA-binding response OmpR family regulator